MWTKLEIGETVHDSAFRITPDHVGRVVEIDSFYYQIRFFDGHIAWHKREELGPLPAINPADWQCKEELDATRLNWCFTCWCAVQPTRIFFNCFGLPRGECPNCGDNVLLNYLPNNTEYLKRWGYDK